MPPTFSIVIPLYNKVRSIAGTVASVLSQTFPDFELIIVDDGSTDGSAEEAARLTDPRIRLVRQANGGVSAARNTGIELADAEYIAFLDADDRWLPTYLEAMYALTRDFPGAGMFGLAYWQQAQGHQYRDDFGLPADFRGYIPSYFAHAVRHFLFWTSAVVVKKSALQQSGGFNPAIHFGEDLDLWFRLALDHSVAFYNKPLAVYDKDAENRSVLRSRRYSTHIASHLAKFKPFEETHTDFRKFINLFRCIHLYELFHFADITSDIIRVYERAIQRKDLPLRFRALLRMPICVQRQILRGWHAISQTLTT